MIGDKEVTLNHLVDVFLQGQHTKDTGTDACNGNVFLPYSSPLEKEKSVCPEDSLTRWASSWALVHYRIPWAINVVNHATSSMPVLLKRLQSFGGMASWFLRDYIHVKSKRSTDCISSFAHAQRSSVMLEEAHLARCLRVSWWSSGGSYKCFMSSRGPHAMYIWCYKSLFVSTLWSDDFKNYVYMSPVVKKYQRGVFQSLWTAAKHPYDSTSTMELAQWMLQKSDGLVHSGISISFHTKIHGNPKCLGLPTNSIYAFPQKGRTSISNRFWMRQRSISLTFPLRPNHGWSP